MTEREIDPHRSIDFIRDNAEKFASAKANRIYLEEFRKTQKAILMRSSMENVIGKQETYAYSHPDYILVLQGIREAVEIEEELRWQMVAAQARVEVFRTQEASKRVEYRVTQ